MDGRSRASLVFVVIVLSGCQEDRKTSTKPQRASVPEIGSSFDPAQSGTIRGRVVWEGAAPKVVPFLVHAYLDGANPNRVPGPHPNPHVPKIDPDSHGVAEGVVVLHGVTPERSAPWRRLPVNVVMKTDRLLVAQGDIGGSVGFVRRGDSIAAANADGNFHALRARGAAYFTLPLVAAEKPTVRRLDQSGIVELSDGANQFWRRGYLFVLDHPYGTLTGSKGQFTLEQVPAGTYEISVWLPDWHVAREERDPETAAINRVVFATPVEVKQTVTVVAGQESALSFTFSEALFAHTGDPLSARAAPSLR